MSRGSAACGPSREQHPRELGEYGREIGEMAGRDSGDDDVDGIVRDGKNHAHFRPKTGRRTLSPTVHFVKDPLVGVTWTA
jgi:hypothetical protein